MSEIAFATYSAMPDTTDDDRLVADLLQARGVSVSAADWDAPGIDWSRFARVVIRSTWDCHLKPGRYAEWLRAFLPMADSLKNPPQAVLENIEVVPTHFQAAGDAINTQARFGQRPAEKTSTLRNLNPKTEILEREKLLARLKEGVFGKHRDMELQRIACRAAQMADELTEQAA